MVCPDIFMEALRKITKDLRVASDPAEVQIKPLMNTNLALMLHQPAQ
jgi:hypothetical protein